MSSFFRFFAERHKLANLFVIMVLLMGLSTWLSIKRDQWPDLDLGEMYVTTIYPGASPEDVELNVTNKLEDELENVTGIKRMTSVSMENISSIRVVIDPDAKDQEGVKREIRDSVGRVTDFPDEVTESPLITDIKTSMIPILEIGISGGLPYGELREIARLFEKKLEVIPGTGTIERFGYRAREIQCMGNDYLDRELLLWPSGSQCDFWILCVTYMPREPFFHSLKGSISCPNLCPLT
jgi:multidrug efflux pump subunit AcrB